MVGSPHSVELSVEEHLAKVGLHRAARLRRSRMTRGCGRGAEVLLAGEDGGRWSPRRRRSWPEAAPFARLSWSLPAVVASRIRSQSTRDCQAGTDLP